MLFAGLGMLAGEEGPGRIAFNDAVLAQNVGVVSLSLILFAGGLGTSWQHARGLLWRAVSLATVGVIVAAFLAGWFASLILGITLAEGLLLGSILASTDAAAVFTVLATSGISLRARLGPLLELESGSNDPMAVWPSFDSSPCRGWAGASRSGASPWRWYSAYCSGWPAAASASGRSTAFDSRARGSTR